MRFFVLYLLEALVAHVQYLIAGLQSTVFPGRAVRRHFQNEHPVLEKESFGKAILTIPPKITFSTSRLSNIRDFRFSRRDYRVYFNCSRCDIDSLDSVERSSAQNTTAESLERDTSAREVSRKLRFVTRAKRQVLFEIRVKRYAHHWGVGAAGYGQANPLVLLLRKLYRRLRVYPYLAGLWILRHRGFRRFVRFLGGRCGKSNTVCGSLRKSRRCERAIGRAGVETRYIDRFNLLGALFCGVFSAVEGGAAALPSFAFSFCSTLLWFGLHTVSVTTPSAFFSNDVACEQLTSNRRPTFERLPVERGERQREREAKKAHTNLVVRAARQAIYVDRQDHVAHLQSSLQCRIVKDARFP